MLPLFLLLLSACRAPEETGPDTDPDSDTATDTDSDTDTDSEVAPVTATVGAQGGSLSLSNGASLTIPAGALTEDVEITVSMGDSTAALGLPALPDGALQDPGPVVVLEPHGLLFEEPVTVSIPTALSGSEVVLWRLPSDSASAEDWIPRGDLSIADGVLSFQTVQFSFDIAGTVAAGACPCYTGADLAQWKRDNRGYYAYSGWQQGNRHISGTNPNNRANRAGTILQWSRSERRWRTYCMHPTWNARQLLTTSAQIQACHSLAGAAFFGWGGSVQVAAFASGLDEDAEVVATVTVARSTGGSASQTVTLTEGTHGPEVVFLTGTFRPGDVVSATVDASPDGYTCTVDGGLGALPVDNTAVRVSCDRVLPECDGFSLADIESWYASVQAAPAGRATPSGAYVACDYTGSAFGDVGGESEIYMVGSDGTRASFEAGTRDGSHYWAYYNPVNLGNASGFDDADHVAGCLFELESFVRRAGLTCHRACPCWDDNDVVEWRDTNEADFARQSVSCTTDSGASFGSASTTSRLDYTYRDTNDFEFGLGLGTGPLTNGDLACGAVDPGLPLAAGSTVIDAAQLQACADRLVELAASDGATCP